MSNPGLEPYDISDYQGAKGLNFFQEDPVLKRVLIRHAANLDIEHAKQMFEHVRGYGDLVSTVIDELTLACHKEGKYGEIVSFDRAGNRVDEIHYSAEQIESRKQSYEYGIVNLHYHDTWKYPFTLTHKMALAMLCNEVGEGGVACPLAMTDGMILALENLGTDEQKELYLPLVAGQESQSYFMCGQYVTERVGGSNVAANRTVARRQPDGTYRLTGEKWFCSNPGDLWVTTARIEDSNLIGMFLVPRLLEDGTKNNYRLLRKKDIIGSRGKVTAECVYEDLYAEPLGRLSHGLANLIRYVIKTSRLHVAAGAAGMGRRALLEAIAYTSVRTAYGKKIIDLPVTRLLLARLCVLQSAMTLSVFRCYEYEEQKNPLSELLMPLNKYASTVTSTYIIQKAMMLHGGNGILGDFSCLPRLLNDSIINETWEGAHPLIQEHALKALSRRKIRQSLESELDRIHSKLTGRKGFTKHADRLQQIRTSFFQMYDSCEDTDLNRQSVCDRLFELLGVAFLFESSAMEFEPSLLRSALPAYEQNEAGAIEYLEEALENENDTFAITGFALADMYEYGREAVLQPGHTLSNPDHLDKIILIQSSIRP